MIREGTIGKEQHSTISNVHLVDDLKHNLLSISQFCDKNYEIMFNAHGCIGKNGNNNNMFADRRIDNIDFFSFA